jgi:hypothetical protein
VSEPAVRTLQWVSCSIGGANRLGSENEREELHSAAFRQPVPRIALISIIRLRLSYQLKFGGSLANWAAAI